LNEHVGISAGVSLVSCLYRDQEGQS
jgi:hypothetical protein